MKKLLLVEDDRMISRTLKTALHYRDFDVTICESVRAGREALEKNEFDLVILDVNLPDGTGYELCKTLREKQNPIPIVMLTARADEASAVRGIESGADDYVRKPFGLEELSARLNRLLSNKTKSNDVISFHSLRISMKQRQAWVGESTVSLGKREFDILALLVKRSGEVVTREEIISTIDTDSEMYDRTVDSHLSHLRRKLKDAELKDVQITPVYGVGYRLENK